MPLIEVNGVSLSYEEHGDGEECIVFVHGLLMNRHMFDAQIEALKTRYRCLAFDLRGQGESEVTRSGYDMDNLTRDTAALIEALDCGPCHFVGLSMGGFIGMRLAIHYPQLLRSLSLLETSADPEPEENVTGYRLMAYTGRLFGFRLLAGRLFPILFGRDFLGDEAQEDTRNHWKRQLIGNNRTGSSRAAMGVIKRDGVMQQLGTIKTPTLIVVGDQDVATIPEKSQRMQEAISNSELVIIPGAGHSSSIEKPADVNQALETFIAAHSS
jgi:3-oxoadipate enol-lactonase